MEHSTLNQTAQKRNVLRRAVRLSMSGLIAERSFSPEFFPALVRCPLR
jgi:hypothetical protein